MDKYLNKKVDIKIDRQLGTKHPKFDWLYPINYGFVAGTIFIGFLISNYAKQLSF